MRDTEIEAELRDFEIMALGDEIDRLLDERDEINNTLRTYKERRKLLLELKGRLG